MNKHSGLSYETRMISVLTLMFGFVFFDRNAMSFLAPFIVSDLQLSNTQVGMLTSALSLTWAISGYTVGAFSDATGRRKPVLLIAIVVFSLCSIGSGIANSFALLLLSRLVMGMAEGGILPISQSLVAMESSAERRGLNMGVMQNFGSNLLGSFAAPLVLVGIATAYHWRIAFFVAAIPGLLCALLVAKYIREPAAPAKLTTSTHRATMPLRDMLKFRNMWLCILISCCMVAWLVIGWTFLPLMYVNLRQFSSSNMSILMSVLGISAAVGSFIVPGLSDRFGRKPVVVVCCFLGALCSLIALHYSGPLWILGALTFICWFANGTFPLFMATVPSETIPPQHISTALGVVMGIGELSGGFIGPTVAGRAADAFGLQAPMLIMAACSLTAAVLALFLIETAPVKTGMRKPIGDRVLATETIK